jgi:CheY-like chemotaxis protein
LLDFSMPGVNGFEVAHELIRIMLQAPLLMFTNVAGAILEGRKPAGCDLQCRRNMDLMSE